MAEPTETHYRIVAKAIAEGRVIPLLGAGVNMLGRPSGTAWQQGRYLPSGVELAAYLAGLFDFPPDELPDLLRVSQYITVMTGSGPLYEKLEQVVLPLYYDDRTRWIWMMKQAISKIACYFNSHRMMRRYAAEAYLR